MQLSQLAHRLQRAPHEPLLARGRVHLQRKRRARAEGNAERSSLKVDRRGARAGAEGRLDRRVLVREVGAPHLVAEPHRIAVALGCAAAPLPHDHRLAQDGRVGGCHVRGAPRLQRRARLLRRLAAQHAVRGRDLDKAVLGVVAALGEAPLALHATPMERHRARAARVHDAARRAEARRLVSRAPHVLPGRRLAEAAVRRDVDGRVEKVGAEHAAVLAAAERRLEPLRDRARVKVDAPPHRVERRPQDGAVGGYAVLVKA
mmetsp:Transcript_38843/g.124713  ORF Transcript_38843/g.124713 Transcript_38843/m.124713 type:complete len:260 (-) Transcript_38843:202-981(-)